MLCVLLCQKPSKQLCIPFHTVLPLHCLAAAAAMDKSRRSSAPWASHGGRREEHKRARDEFDHVAQGIVAKMKRELSGRLKDDADRLRRERNKVDAENDKLRADNDRLRAECDRKSAAPSQLEQQLTKRFKTALEDAFEEVLGAPMTSEGTDPSEEDGAAPTLPEETPANSAENGPGDAAPSPQREEEDEEEKIPEEALEQAVHRSEMPQGLSGQ